MINYTYLQNLKEILSIFNEYKLVNNVILIGSWCEIFYKELLDDFIPNIRTRDLDFFIPNPNYKTQKISMIAELKKHGYLYDEDRGTTKSKFFRKDGFEVEFITVLSRNYANIRKIEFMDVNAECLNDMNMFLSNTIKYEFEPNLFVTIPTPEAFILHKLLINENRKVEKQIKDGESIQRVYNSIIKDEIRYTHLKSIYNKLSKKEKKRINNSIERLHLSIDLEKKLL